MGEGIYFNPGDGGQVMEITAGLRIPSFCQLENFRWDVNIIPISGYVAGSRVIVMPRNPVYHVYRDANLIPTIGMLDSISFLGSSIRYNTWWSDGWDRVRTFDSTVFQILPASSGKGIFVSNSSDFTAITDASTVGFCVWRGRVTVTGSWPTPATNVARERYQVFARWDAPNVTVEFDGYNVTAYLDTGSDADQAASVVMDIAIFASGVAPTPGDGINIFNANGDCVFSLTKRPFIYEDFTFTPSWTAVSIGNRMVMLGRYGYDSNTNNSWAYVKWAGLVMTNGTVRAGRGRIVALWTDQYSVNGRRLTQVPIPCISNMY